MFMDKNLGFLSILIAVIGCSIITFIFFNRFTFSLEASLDSWVKTATYFSSVFSPLLLFASILLLYRTWKDSKTALDYQREELIAQRHNYERHIKNQELKDKLEIFARRVRELSEKFTNQKMSTLINNVDLANRINQLEYNSLNNNIIASFKLNKTSSEALLKSIEKIDKHTLSPYIIFDYCYTSSLTLGDVFAQSFYEIENDDDLYDILKKAKNSPDYYVKYIIAYALISSSDLVVEIRAFYSLIYQIINLDEVNKKLFVDELLLNFNERIAQNLIYINKNTPNDALNIH